MTNLAPYGGTATICALLRWRAQTQPQSVAFTALRDDGSEDESVTYEALDRDARHIGGTLVDRVGPAAHVLLLLPTGLGFVRAFFGCLCANVVAIPAPPLSAHRLARSLERLDGIAKNAAPTLVIATSALIALKDEFGGTALAHARWVTVDELLAGTPSQSASSGTDPDAIAYLQYTSGSTSHPKGVMVSQRNLYTCCRNIATFKRYTPQSVSVCWVPAFHDDGLVHGICTPVYNGSRAILMSPESFITRPARWLEVMTRYEATHSGGPDFAYALCVRKVSDADLASLRLDRWAVAYNAAEPIRPATLRDFSARFGRVGFRWEAWAPCYGLAEATLSVSVARRGAGPRLLVVDQDRLEREGRIAPLPQGAPGARELVSCGEVVDGTRVRVVDAATSEPRAEDEVGEIWVGGPTVATGYLNDEDASEEVFGARLGSEGPFLRTGDLGFLHDGELFVSGRLKDLIIVRGRNLYPQDIEQTVERSHPAFRPGRGAAIAISVDGEERLVVLHELSRRPDSLAELLNAARQSVVDQHDVDPHDVVVVEAGGLPLTSSGKIQRGAARQAWLGGSLPVIATLRRPQGGTPGEGVSEALQTSVTIQRWLLVRVATRACLPPEELELDKPFARYGVDSLASVELMADLEAWLGRKLSPTLVWEHPTIGDLAKHLADHEGAPALTAAAEGDEAEPEPLAIIGLGCRFPGASDPDAFWRLVRDGGDAIREVPSDRWDIGRLYDPDPGRPGTMNTRWGGFLDDIDQFDPNFFGITPREASRMDPQQRVLLEVIWEALESAGIGEDRYAGRRVGVFVGISSDDYSRFKVSLAHTDAYVGTGNASSIAANRVSYLLDLHGPSVALDTACSSSLVAAHVAARSLWAGECEMAIVGGVNILLDPSISVTFTKARMLAADGRCKAFDAAADGYVRSEGAGAVVLKPLSRAMADGDPVFALIRSTAVNQDGRSNGLTAPNPKAQEAVVLEACRRARVSPGQISYVEAHGTGTSLGDPIEANALGRVLALGRPAGEHCAIGTVKSNIGHLEAASGIAGLVKVALMMRHRQIPPSLHFQKPNPRIAFDDLPIRVQTELSPWRAGPRLAGLNSFGFGGTNAHVLLGEAPAGALREEQAPLRRTRILPLSAHSPEALRVAALRMAQLLDDEGRPPLDDICYTAAVRRTHHEHRLAVIGDDAAELAQGLARWLASGRTPEVVAGRRPPGGTRGPVFVFPGQGAQGEGMGRALMAAEPVVRITVERCDELFRAETGWSFLQIQEEDPASVHRTEVTQPALFALQVGLAALWRSWGVTASAVVGHSVGELAAAHAAGVLSLEESIRILAHRGRLMSRVRGQGMMVSVELPQAEVLPLLEGTEVVVAATNEPGATVISGDSEAVGAVLRRCEERGVGFERFKGQYAFHSPQMEPIGAELPRVMSRIEAREARLPIVSTHFGRRITGVEMDATYWGRQIAEPVRFLEAVGALADEGYDCFLELSPHPALLGALTRGMRHLGRSATLLASLRRGRDEHRALLAAVGGLHTSGQPLDWSRFHSLGGEVVPLPSYPWQRQRCWYSPEVLAEPEPDTGTRHPLLGRPLGGAHPTWERRLGVTELPYLADHRVMGSVLLPATATVALAEAAAGELLDKKTFIFTDLTFERMLAFQGEEVQNVQVTLAREGEGKLRLEIHHRPGADAAWSRHALATVHEEAAPPPPPCEPIAEIQARLPERRSGEALYEELRALGFAYGETFRAVTRLWRRDGEALAELEAPEGVRGGQQVHPALLDAALHPLSAAMPLSGGDGLALPVRMDRVRIHGPIPDRAYSHVRLRGADQGTGLLEADVRVMDASGALAVEIQGLRLRRVGAEAGAAPTVDLERWRVRLRWAPLERAPGPATPGTWLLLADAEGVAEGLARDLVARGQRVILADPEGVDPVDGRLQVRPEAVGPLLRDLAGGEGPPLRGAIYLWSCRERDAGHEPAQGAETGAWSAVAALEVARSVIRAFPESPPRLLLLTRHAVGVEPSDLIRPEQAPLWGLGRVLANEHPSLRSVLLDLDAPSPELAEAVLVEDAEGQLALRGGRLLAARLRPWDSSDAAACRSPSAEGGEQTWHLRVSAPGSPDNLRLEPSARRAPGPGQVEIEVHATGLNFRDVMKSLGIYPSSNADHLWLGDECAGRVVAVGPDVGRFAVGDAVLGIAPDSFARYVTTSAAYVARKPEGISFEEAAAIPIAFTTAWRALVDLGRLQPGERVLIHAAAGGVGLAAIQIARLIGAEVYATAGSDAKRDFLRSLGVEHVMSSRDLAFAEQIAASTDGRGVDVVLNSLAGEAIGRSLESLAPFGRFLEIGKRDIYQNTNIGLSPFKNNLSFSAIDMDAFFQRRPEEGAALFDAVMARFASGELRPPPCKAFPLPEVVGAFRYMALRRNIGKIVVTQDPAAPRQLAGSASWLRADGTYLITGGLGGIGGRVAAWMARNGARHIVLAGRRGAGPEAERALDALRAQGVDVRVRQADVASPGQVEGLVSGLVAMPPLRGVIHAAGLIADALLTGQDAASMRRVLAPKVQGAWNLHRATAGCPLDFFVLFSSVSAVIGTPGQANYAAGNAYMDALAELRARQGLPALSIQWGAWSEVGMAARSDAPQLRALGTEAIPPALGVESLGALLGASGAVVVAPVRWPRLARALGRTGIAPIYADLAVEEGEEPAAAAGGTPAARAIAALPPEQRPAEVQRFFKEQLARVMELDPGQIDAEQPLGALGFDSLMALELLNSAESGLGVRIPLDGLSQGANIRRLAEVVLPLVDALGLGGAPPAASPAPEAPPRPAPAPIEAKVARNEPAPARSVQVRRRTPPGPWPAPEMWARHARPLGDRMLRALGLDARILWAQGDRLGVEIGGRSVEVLDLLGDFGVTLLGHNPPALVERARQIQADCPPERVPFARSAPALLLAAALSERMEASCGRAWRALLVRTEEDAVALAIEHARLEWAARVERWQIRQGRSLNALLHAGRRVPTPTMPAELRAQIRGVLGEEPAADPADVQRRLMEHAARLMRTEPAVIALEGLGSEAQVSARIARDDVAGLREAVRAATVAVHSISIGVDGSLSLESAPWCGVAAVLVEPVPSERGGRVLGAAAIAELNALSAACGFPVVLDETHSALGRAGAMTAAERLGLHGHYVLLGSALGGGIVRLSALLVERDRYQEEIARLRSPRLAEGEATAQIALEVLAELDRAQVARRCADSGAWLLEELQALARRYPEVIRGVDGLGLALSVELRDQGSSPSRLIRAIYDQDLLGVVAMGYLNAERGVRVGVSPQAPNVLVLTPSAAVSREDLGRARDALERLCLTLLHGNAGHLMRYFAGAAAVGDDAPIADWRGRTLEDIDVEIEPGERQVAFIVHFTDEAEVALWDPTLSELSPPELRTLFDRVHRGIRPAVGFRFHGWSESGERVYVNFVSFLITSRLIEAALRAGDTGWLVRELDQATRRLIAAGCEVVGYGGFLSILAHNGRRISAAGAALTTGNSLTVAMGLAALREGCARQGVVLARARLGAVGARGNICSTYVRIMASEVADLLLIGRGDALGELEPVAARIYGDALARIRTEPVSSLTGIAAAIRETAAVRALMDGLVAPEDPGRWLLLALREELGEDRHVQMSSDLSTLRGCQVVVSATNASEAILRPEHFGHAPVVVCDLSVPPDLSPEVAQRRPDILALRGGLVRIPRFPEFLTDTAGLGPGDAFACLAETILLGLSGCTRNYSFGEVDREDVAEIDALARRHGFRLGGLKT